MGSIVSAIYPSVTYGAVASRVLECDRAATGGTECVNMVVTTDGTTKVVMKASVGPKMDVDLSDSTGGIIRTYAKQLFDGYKYGYMTIITRDEMDYRMLMSQKRKGRAP